MYYARLMRDPGDGRITRVSQRGRTSLDPSTKRPFAAFSAKRVVFVCASHATILGNVNFRQNILNCSSSDAAWTGRRLACNIKLSGNHSYREPP